MSKKPSVLILDYEQWKCGLDDPHNLGKGPTVLLNNEKYMCCLGQFSLQLGASEDEIRNCGSPAETRLKNWLTSSFEGGIENTRFSKKAMKINDKTETTPKEKIRLLTELCKKESIELVVLNEPAK
jgi:hypothetical protein